MRKVQQPRICGVRQKVGKKKKKKKKDKPHEKQAGGREKRGSTR